MTIKVLDTQLANQIAAGEVVERPASVVKELMENSFDAQCQQVWIDIGQGGHELIRVRDDGDGVSQNDLVLALQRHATSKISILDDLERVCSLGFRGEALASIAAVSRLRLLSQQRQADSAWGIYHQNGVAEIKPVAHPCGTTVEVCDLFYNTPARRKFLRQPKTEFMQITQVVQRLALSRFDLAIKLSHNQREVFHATPADDSSSQQQRVAAILGAEFMQHAVYIELNAAGMHLRGWIASPRYTRSLTDMQYCYINGRFVRDKLLAQAVRRAYHDVLFQGRHPAYLLYLQIDPAQVDVNVHPTKHEVRFRNSRLVFDFVKRALDDALAQIRPGAPLVNTSWERVAPATATFSDTANSEFDRASTNTPASANLNPSADNLSYKVNATVAAIKVEQPQQQGLSLSLQEPAAVYTVMNQISPDDIITKATTITDNASKVTDNALGFALAQLQHIYILAQNQHGLIIVDMHAAHERILYEQMKADMVATGIARQSLLIPVSVDLNAMEFECWETQQAALSTLGLVSAQVGPHTIVVREVPAIWPKLDVAQLIRDILADYSSEQQGSERTQDVLHELLASFACRAAIHAQRKLSLAEMNALLRQMENTRHGGVCNHGRPSWVQLTIADLDKLFLRGR